MPSYGEKQKSAGIDISKPYKKLGDMSMVSRDMTIRTTLKIDNCACEYKGNPVLNANR
jgi:hypothetical protein|tara:strand:+ start:372 stop:545 length:174 start_codon:yes stop_codon:yes gene_type:complete